MAKGIKKIGGDDSDWYREEVVKAERGNREHLARHDRSFSAIMAKADAADGDENDRNRNDDGNASVHPAVQIATLLVASGKFPGHAQALDYLLNTSRGQAHLSRMHKAAHRQTSAKETSMTSHTEFVQSVVKQYGIVALAKSMVRDQNSYDLDEHQFTQLATEHAQRVYPNDRPDVAFSKLYEREEAVRRACQVAKAMPFVANLEPLMVGGESARDVNDPSEAIAQLKQLGARKWPTASEAQQFENALVDPVNHKLARQAVPIPQPTTAYPFPR